MRQPKLHAQLHTHNGAYITVNRGTQWEVRINLHEATHLADQLVDLYEQCSNHASNAENPAPTTTANTTHHHDTPKHQHTNAATTGNGKNSANKPANYNPSAPTAEPPPTSKQTTANKHGNAKTKENQYDYKTSTSYADPATENEETNDQGDNPNTHQPEPAPQGIVSVSKDFNYWGSWV